MRKVPAGFLCLLLALSMAVLPGCGKKTATEGQDSGRKISVYTSFYVMYDFTRKIGGDRINVTNLVPAGTEPHDWEPSPGDMANIEKADVLIYNGAGMETWIDQVINSINNKKMIKVEAAQGLKLQENSGETGTGSSGDLAYDPHVWLDPMLAKQEMEAIKNALATADPGNKDFYEKNYADNSRKLTELDREYKTAVAEFSRKDIVVAHQAFGYLCHAYGLNQVAIEGLAADSEPSPARMAEIIKYAKANNLRYIFFEELVSPKVAETIAKETGASTAVLNPLEGLTESDINAGKEYFSVMRDNLSVLREALN